MLDQKFIYIFWQSQKLCARQKDDLHSVKLVFVPAVKFLGWLKIFGPAQNILGPVKGQGINLFCLPIFCIHTNSSLRNDGKGVLFKKVLHKNITFYDEILNDFLAI